MKFVETLRYEQFDASSYINFYKVNICNKTGLERVIKKEKPEEIIHFASETHVDRSINDINIFIRTNSGGEPLSFSDLLMSITTAHWKSDAR